MKFYLASYTIIDGEHEHIDRLLIRSADLKSAKEQARNEEYGSFDDDTDKCLSYGDGQTVARLSNIIEITPSEAEVLIRLRVV